MTCGINPNIGRDKDIIAQGDRRAVEDHQIDVGIDIFADVNMVTIITVKGRFNT